MTLTGWQITMMFLAWFTTLGAGLKRLSTLWDERLDRTRAGTRDP